MAVCDLRYLGFTVWILHCSVSQPVFDCPKPVAYGDSAVLKCSNLKKSVSIRGSTGIQMGTCVDGKCAITVSMEEKMNITFTNNTMLLTVHSTNSDDDGEWNCESEGKGSCFLHVYKLPSCEIRSTKPTNILTIGQDLLLNISLSKYYCTNSIAWNLQIGGKPQNITEFQKREETGKISNRFVEYSPTVTSSLTSPVQLTFNCNDETHDVSCSGVEELKLRVETQLRSSFLDQNTETIRHSSLKLEPPYCILTSDNTDALTIGNNLTLEAAIEEYPCTSGIEYALLVGSLMVTEFVRRGSLFYATFEVKPVYLDKQLQLQYTCNNVSATTRTRGVEMLFKKEGFLKYWIQLVIGLITGFVVIAVLFGIIFCRNRRRRGTPSNEASVYNIPTSYNDNEDRYQELTRVVTLNQVQDVDYLTPQPPTDTQNLQNVAYEII